MSERVIHILPEHVASQIAAGEVVERPASALKELVENSLDAGARAIEVELERGGAGLIAVGDDGAGMTRADAILSLRRHATSKIRDAADLTAIRTLGFRGEALAAIASVSRLRMRTRTSVNPEGVELLTEGGDDPAVHACAIAPGTRIEARDLFFNTPARLKFLKTPAAEQSAAAETLQRIALVNYRIAFKLRADNRELFDTPPVSSAIERLRQLYGERLAERMLPIEACGDNFRLHGLIGSSQESFASGRLILLYVNGRTVRDRALIRAVVQAYQHLMPRGRFPAAVLLLELPAGEVDVNVHPMKTEVRFRRPGAAFEMVLRTIRGRLADRVEGPGIAMAPVSAAPSGIAQAALAAAVSASAPMPSAVPMPERILRLVTDHHAAGPAQSPLGLGFGRSASESEARPADATTRVPPKIRYSAMRPVGQLFAGYVALEDVDSMILLDQHAAHERVTFEKLRAELRAGGINIQPLLTPVTIALNSAQAARVFAAITELRAIGFDLEPFGGSALLLKGAPAIFGADRGARLLSDLIETAGDHGLTGGGDGALDDALKTLACHGSIRVGRILHTEEIAELLAALDLTEFNATCPHGRPVHLEFRRSNLERMFRR
jgi:DNA mismatch repair protein MutL